MQRLAREKICLQERLASLKVELSRLNIEVDLDHWKVDPEEQDSNSTSTATGKKSPISETESACLLMSTSDSATGDTSYLSWRTQGLKDPVPDFKFHLFACVFVTLNESCYFSPFLVMQ